MVPILSYHFFQFPIRWPIHFFGGLRFFENFPYYCNSVTPFLWIWRGQKNLCFGKNGCWCQFPFSRHWYWRMRRMPKWRIFNGGCRNGRRRIASLHRLVSTVILRYSYCKVPRNDVTKCNECVKKNVPEPTRVYYRWKSLLE